MRDLAEIEARIDRRMPPSEESRRIVRQAYMRHARYLMRRSLESGGYSEREIEAIIAVVGPFLESTRRPSPDDIRTGLAARGIDRETVDIVANAFAS